jgi:hypothetical protein
MTRRLAYLLVLGAVAIGPWSAAAVAAQDVSINIGIGATPAPPPVVVTRPPQLVVVPGTPVYYAPAMPVNYFFYAGQYYTFAKGQWFVASAYNGPWVVMAVGQVPAPILAVPVEYYKIPPGHVKKAGPPPWAGHGKGPKQGKGK